MKNNYNFAFSKTKPKITSGEKNWYKHANHVIEHLHTVYDISISNIEKYIVYHMLDMFLLQEKMIILNYLFSEEKQNYKNELDLKLISYMQQYFNSKIVKRGDQTGIVLTKENTWKLFIKDSNNNESSKDSDESDTNNIWKDAEPEDYKFFDVKIDDFIVDDDKINTIVGFINMFKNQKMVFKIKDVRQARNNTGARCGDSTTKSDAIKLLNLLLNSIVYDDKTEIMLFGICVITEILMRYFTDIQKDGKVYFLTPEQASINDIAKFSRT